MMKSNIMNRFWTFAFFLLGTGIVAKNPTKPFKPMFKMRQEPVGPHKAMLDTICDYKGQRTFLLSYPRSGNTWLRYCLEYLTARPTMHRFNMKDPMNQPLGWCADFPVDCNKPPIEKVHTKREMQRAEYDPENDLLIVIVRNPKEAIARHLNKDITFKTFKGGRGKLSLGSPYTYFENLMVYNSWKPENRILIYYEDLITDPDDVLTALLLFLNEPLDNLYIFMQNFAEHKKNAISIYQKSEKESKTKGDDLLFHSKKMSPDHRKEIDSWAEQLYPELWRTYLKDRYAEENNIYL